MQQPKFTYKTADKNRILIAPCEKWWPWKVFITSESYLRSHNTVKHSTYGLFLSRSGYMSAKLQSNYLHRPVSSAAMTAVSCDFISWSRKWLMSCQIWLRSWRLYFNFILFYLYIFFNESCAHFLHCDKIIYMFSFGYFLHCTQNITYLYLYLHTKLNVGMKRNKQIINNMCLYIASLYYFICKYVCLPVLISFVIGCFFL